MNTSSMVGCPNSSQDAWIPCKHGNQVFPREKREALATLGLVHGAGGHQDRGALLRQAINHCHRRRRDVGPTPAVGSSKTASPGGERSRRPGRAAVSSLRSWCRQAFRPRRRLSSVSCSSICRRRASSTQAIQRSIESHVLRDLGEVVVESETLRHVSDPAAHLLWLRDHVVTSDHGRTGRWSHQAAEYVNGGGLARAVRPEQAEDLTRPDLQIEMVHRHPSAEGLGEAVHDYCVACQSAGHWRASSVDFSPWPGAGGLEHAGRVPERDLHPGTPGRPAFSVNAIRGVNSAVGLMATTRPRNR